MELIPHLGLAAGIVMGVIALLLWRKASSFHVLLLESSSRIEMLKHENYKLEKDKLRLDDKLKQQKADTSRIEKNLENAKGRLKTEIDEVQAKFANYEESGHQKDLKIDHLRGQVDSLTQQLRESDAEKAELKRAARSHEEAQDKAVNDATSAAKEEASALKKRCAELEQEVKTQKRRVERITADSNQVDPKVVKTLKRRLKHTEKLYNSMRGLREMADERSLNWEVALRSLATNMLVQKNISVPHTETDPLGPIVGAALESIGARMVYDEYVKIEKPEKSAPAPIAAPSGQLAPIEAQATET